jgi:hypothetical protein
MHSEPDQFGWSTRLRRRAGRSAGREADDLVTGRPATGIIVAERPERTYRNGELV